MEHPYLPDFLRDQRPWGFFERLTSNRESTVKLITVHAGEALSLQTHAHRDEYWRILSGEGTITIGDNTTLGHAGDEFFVLRGTTHRVEGGKTDITFLEIAFGAFDENDIVRLEDRYDRPTQPSPSL